MTVKINLELAFDTSCSCRRRLTPYYIITHKHFHCMWRTTLVSVNFTWFIFVCLSTFHYLRLQKERGVHAPWRNMSVLSTHTKDVANKEDNLHAHIPKMRKKRADIYTLNICPKRRLHHFIADPKWTGTGQQDQKCWLLQSRVNCCTTPSTLNFLFKLDRPALELHLVLWCNLESMHLFFS